MATSRQRAKRPPVTEERQNSGLETLGAPLPLAPPRQTLPSDESVVRLLDRYREIVRPPNIYQASFTRFASRLCYTIDESRAGVVARFPSERQDPGWAYLRELDDLLLTRTPLIIPKSRRVLVSWRVCCFDIWIAAGGQDPRWPALMRETRNRKVVLIAQKLEDPGGSAWYLSDRIKPILQEFEERGLRRLWPDFPEWEYRYGAVNFSNGGGINAIPHGPDQARGAAGTFVHCEEVSAWESAGPTMSALLPLLRPDGHLAAICTPKANTWAYRAVHGLLRQGRRA